MADYDNILDDLFDDDPNVRKAALREIYESQNTDFVDDLLDFVSIEQNPKLQELGKKVLSSLQKIGRDSQWLGDDSAGDTASPKSKTTPINPKARAKAEQLLERATGLSMQGSNEAAYDVLEKAYQADPSIREDEYSMNVFKEITGKRTDDAAYNFIMYERKDLLEAGGSKRKSKSGKFYGDEVAWSDAITDLAIYWIVTAGITVAAFVLIFLKFQQIMTSMDATRLNAPGLEVFYDFFGAGIAALIVYALLSSLLSVIGLLFWYAVIHFVSTSFLNGEGTYRGLIKALTLWMTGFTVMNTVVVGIFYNFFLDAILANPNMTARDFSSILNMLLIISGIFSIVVALIISGRIGIAYDFGMGKGCASIIISYFLIVIIAIAFGCAFSVILSSTALTFSQVF
ncbi:hypothetical protein MASR2M15_05840 [Anaerolineales bacterium]